MKYNVYPKTTTTDTPDPISFDCEGWHRDGLLIRPLNSFNQPSESALLLADNIAAIVPEVQPKQTQNMRDPFHFQVYLKGRTKPLEIAAHVIQSVDDQIQFGWLIFDMKTSQRTVFVIPEIYVSASEVVAVVPLEPLPHTNVP